ncbi:MAG: Ig-like domain-containing protein [Agathobacter sp.]|nr:Ig-like domain-containing protein [Agathobacter sp.]
MKQFKKIFATVLMACMIMSLCACGNTGTGDSEKDSNKPSTEKDTTVNTGDTGKTSEDDDKVQYTVKVVDESGNPIADALVQMCSDTCFPSKTDANGVATFNLTDAEYKVSFLTLPAGYTHVGTEENYYFDGDATELTITLKKAE